MRTVNSKLKSLAILLKEAYNRWELDGGSRLGASLSFYTTFSLAPLLLISISITGFFLGHEKAHTKILNEVRSTMGRQAASTIEDMMEAGRKPASAVTFATVVGFVALLLGASVVMSDVKYTLNKIWGVKSPRGLTGLIKDRLLAVGMVLAIGFLLLVSLVASTLISTLGSLFEDTHFLPKGILQFLNFVISFGFITLLFAAIFKVLPSAKIKWADVWLGAGLTSLFFTIGKQLLGFYLEKGFVADLYGTASSVLVVLLWLYYSAQILYFGAEFTKIYSDHFSARPRSITP